MTVSSIAPTPLSYWHLWTDGEGISHQQLCSFRPFSGAPLNPNVAAQWSSPLLEDGNSFLTQLPVGWLGEWHENSVPKWIFVLSGAWFVESMDGVRRTFRAGEFCFGGDQGCQRTADGRWGHLSGQIGAEPCLQLILQRNDDAWRNAPPGFFS
ncbi:MAG: cupin domain-containing protein [Synechococcaceae cyanobacterium]|nr:cupin domain-containing protein [Synechococcaceae cyanobacterium]